jgi:hypothetical protein
VYKLEDWLGRLEKELGIHTYEPVEVIERTTGLKKKMHKRKNL